MDEEGFYAMNQSNPSRFVKLTYDWVASNWLQSSFYRKLDEEVQDRWLL